MRLASETDWRGERKGPVVTRAALAGRRSETEWISVHSRASSKKKDAKMIAIRFAKQVGRVSFHKSGQ